MKKYLFALLLPMLIMACGPSKEELLQAKIDSLEAQNSVKETALNDFMETVSAVEDNLKIIKERESIITVSATEGSDDAKTRINDDVNAIYTLMEENKQKVEELEKKLKDSRYQGAKYKKMIEQLKTRIEEQAQEIVKLQRDLAEKNIIIEGLNDNLAQLQSNVDTLTQTTAQQREKIKNQTEALHTAYYIVGTQKELKTAGVIDREGGMLGMGKTSTLSQNLSTDNFTRIDITKLKSIPIHGDKAELISKHPAGSYNFVGEKPVETLEITDPDKFWSLTKYLVVQIR